MGLRLAWSPATKLTAELSAPHLVLETETLEVPVALPVIAADGSVTLPPAAWDGVEVLVGHLGALTGGLLGRVVDAFGWAADGGPAGGDAEIGARLRLADFAVDARAALAAWLPRLALSDRVHDAMSMLADLFATTSSGAGRFARGFVEGTGHPDDPYRFALGADLPNVALWFPPAGLDDRLFAVPQALREWRPGFDGLDACRARGGAARRSRRRARRARARLRPRPRRRPRGAGAALARRRRPHRAAGQRAGRHHGAHARRRARRSSSPTLDVEREFGRVPATIVYVALGPRRDGRAAGARVVDLSTPGLAPQMFAAPAAPATGDWYVRLGTRADCRAATSSTDGTPEQAERLARVLDALAAVSNDIAIVAFAGAGHAARLAADARGEVKDLLLLGTPLAAISLTALATQPTADALRLLHRLLPAARPRRARRRRPRARPRAGRRR